MAVSLDSLNSGRMSWTKVPKPAAGIHSLSRKACPKASGETPLVKKRSGTWSEHKRSCLKADGPYLRCDSTIWKGFGLNDVVYRLLSVDGVNNGVGGELPPFYQRFDVRFEIGPEEVYRLASHLDGSWIEDIGRLLV